MSVVVLMYHAVCRDDATMQRMAPGERRYAVPVDRYERQLAMLRHAGLPILDPASLDGVLPERGVVLTFDDGHASQIVEALPRLQARGATAAFFVTTGWVGRPGYASWSQVRHLAEAGMTVGSHGVSHRFFDDMDDRAAAAEFRESRLRLEDCIGAPVRQMAFPGGRFRTHQLQLGRDAGYAVLHGSGIGRHRGGVPLRAQPVRRIAVRRDTTDARFVACARGERPALLPMQAVAGLKHAMRTLLGNDLYRSLHERSAR